MVTAHKPPREATPPPHDTVAFSNEQLLPMGLIRQHTKTDDVPSVSDELLELYRDSAIEAAQEYTGLLFRGQKQVTETVPPQRGRYSYLHEGFAMPRQTVFHASHPFAQGIAYLYGLRATGVRRIAVDVGQTKAYIPFTETDFGINVCCNPCSDGGFSNLRIQYATGLSCVEEVPANFRLGALKYIAHVIENPGDIVLAVSQSGAARTTGVSVDAAANPVIASGAVEFWRVLKPNAI